MTIKDYKKVHALWLSTPGMGLNDIDDSRDGIAKYLERNPKTCFVAITQNDLSGVILAGHDGRRGYIHHTAVAVSERGKGIGSALVDTALRALEAEGISKVALFVFKKNEIGNEFWERKGFTVREDLNYRNRPIKELRRMDT
jgi:ribosomal protein S18 acetylase RimI-like enzyme